MLATTKTVRRFVKALNGGKGLGYGNNYTDKCAGDDGMRRLCFRLQSKAAADKLARDLNFALFAAGYDNEVVRTSGEGGGVGNGWGGEYIRVRAVMA